MKLPALFSLSLACAALAPGIAYADIPPPQRSACYDKKIGEACTFGLRHSGSCAVQRCKRLGEAHDCVMCVEVTETSEGPSYVVEPEGAFATPLFDASTTTSTSSGGIEEQAPPAPVPPSGGCGRCAAGLGDGADRAAALAIAALACLWLARKRR